MTFWRNGSGFRRMLLLGAVGGSLLAGMASHGWAASKPGIVKLKAGDTFQGEVDEGTAGKVIIVTAKGKFEFNSQIVDSVTYFATPKEEFDFRLSKLGKNDVPGRVALARWALSKNDMELAEQAVASAKAVDPANAEVVALEKQLVTARPKTTTAPTTTQPAATQAVAKPAVGPARRMLTADEMHAVRVREMRPGDKSVRLQVSADLRKKAMDAGVFKAIELRTMTPNEIALAILKSGPPELQREVKVTGDPVSLTEFRMKVNKSLVAGCASAACHGGAAGGRLVLFPSPEKEENSLTNFVILQKFEKSVGGADRSMIDRTQPSVSLLVNYMLPPEVSRSPHPPVQGFKPISRTMQDANFAAVMEWMGKTLIAVSPGYDDIDLTEQPKPAK